VILRKAAALRRRRKIKLGDAIIGATALEVGGELVTRNEHDFLGIEGLQVINPFTVR
jgi:predicted nucleic acid-binding protein